MVHSIIIIILRPQSVYPVRYTLLVIVVKRSSFATAVSLHMISGNVASEIAYVMMGASKERKMKQVLRRLVRIARQTGHVSFELN